MPGVKGRKGKREKKIDNSQDLSKAEGRQKDISGTVSAGVLPAKINQKHVTEMLSQFFLGNTFFEPFINF